MLVCLLGGTELNKEETGPEVVLKQADFLLQTGLLWVIKPSEPLIERKLLTFYSFLTLNLNIRKKTVLKGFCLYVAVAGADGMTDKVAGKGMILMKLHVRSCNKVAALL